MPNPAPLLRAEELCIQGPGGEGIDLSLTAGDRWGILGERESGKTSLLRALARLDPPAGGRLWWFGNEVTKAPRWRLRRWRGRLALVLSNPYRAFAPPTPIAGLALRGGAGVRQELEAVGLSSSLSRERVKALSGAQRVRLAVALALTGTLEVLMVDDVFDHLAPEVWGELQSDIDRALGKGALVLASRHEEALRGMKQLLVLRRGVAVEWGGQQEIRAAPAHPYTQALLEGTPPPDVEGETQPVVRLGESHWARVPRS